MKTTKFTLISSLGLLLACSVAQAQPAGPPHGPHAPRPPRGPVMPQGLLRLLVQYDVNKDGQLDTSEMATLKADVSSGKIAPPARENGAVPHRPLAPEVAAQYDVNEDGTLDENERQALQADIRSGKLILPGAGGGPLHRTRPTAQQLLETFDTNRDSALDAAELESFLSQAPPPGLRHERVPPLHAPEPPGK